MEEKVSTETNEQLDYDYVVVGSGAGGGPLSANLAKAGYKVLLLEAGSDRENYNYQVPAFHGLATEDKDMRWDYFVRHYWDDKQQRRDSKFIPERNGVLYPRAGTLGGCTAHHAMITVYPHNSDWDKIAEITGDSSWNSDNMRKYFERLERCQYYLKNRFFPFLSEFVRSLGINLSRHGFDGWLTTNKADPELLVTDKQLLKIVLSAVKTALAEDIGNPLVRLKTQFDPNDWRVATGSPEGLCFTPLSTNEGKRNGTREYIRKIQQEYPNNLIVKTNALVTRVLFDDDNTAIGVEYFEGEHLYRADPSAQQTNNNSQVRQTVLVNREVILSAGAFNTPQILKLSGIGPREELTKFGIEVRVDLPGVGENLQDRYEVGIVSEMREDFSLLENCTFKSPESGEEPDACFSEWLSGQGVYTTNGAIISIIKKSKRDRPDPDLFIFGLAALFKGYFPDYSKTLGRDRNYFTWAILKGHTQNTAGRVTLRSNDPQDVPEINFHYFDEGNDTSKEDLESMVEGVEFVRRVTQFTRGIIKQEVVPGENVKTKEQIEEFVKNEAWGHHACGTCKIGRKDDKMAVLDGDFRVYGTQNLRVVDASVFPYIPGFFIVTPIYMISEKASDVILAYAKTTNPRTPVQ
jgi:choline dehydrogenase